MEFSIAIESAAPMISAGSQGTLSIVNADLLMHLITMEEVIDVISAAMIAISEGKVLSPERWAMPVGNEWLMGLMPGAIPGQSCYGVKVLSLRDREREGGRGHQGIMILFDADSGQPVCVIDAAALTGLRTAAATAVATKILGKPEARIAALLGCGEQADWHLESLRLARNFEEYRVWGRSELKVAQFIAKHHHRGLKIVAAPTAEAAVRGADVICTLTSSAEPVLRGKWLSTGQHINLVGASTRASREVDEAAVAKVQFFVDSREHALSQAGDLRHAMDAGLVGVDHVAGEIGDLLNGRIAGREGPEALTAYKSLGHIAQDLFVAEAVHSRSLRSLSVTHVDWTGARF